MNTILFVLLSTLLLSAQIQAQQENSQFDYTYYYFEQEWGDTICLTRDCTEKYAQDYNGANFNVHGLWPNGQTGDACKHWSTCTDVEYSEKQIKPDLLEWLESNQVGLYNSATWFREHEFEKHGSCYAYKDAKTNEEKINEYFGQIRTQTTRYDLAQALLAEGIVANELYSYQLSEFQEALASQFKTKDIEFIFTCQKIDGKQYIEAVGLCLDLNFNLMECTCSYGNCNEDEEIFYPNVLNLNDNYEEEIIIIEELM